MKTEILLFIYKIIKNYSFTEYVVLSSMIEKFNERYKKQTRIFMLTNFAVYNILEKSFFKKSFNSRVKRVIPLEKIFAVSVSRFGNEFTIHIPDEYDYRFLSLDFREQILQNLCAQYNKQTNKRLGFFYIDEFTLESWTTTKLDIKKTPKIVRTPQLTLQV